MDIGYDQKISQLFVERGVRRYARSALDEERLRHWWHTVVEVQRRIYRLDTHYEDGWELGSEREERLWHDLAAGSRKLPRDSLEAFERAVFELRKYGSDEARLHCFDVIEDREWSDILYRKSADVSLARELVYALEAEEQPSVRMRRFCRTFDQLAEVWEDMYDLHEDGCDWNLNFWLSPIRQGASAEGAVENGLTVMGELASKLEDWWLAMSSVERGRVFREWSVSVATLAKFQGEPVRWINRLNAVESVPYGELAGYLESCGRRDRAKPA